MKKLRALISKYWQIILTVLYTAVLFSAYIIAAAKGLPHLLRFGVLFLLLYAVGVVLIGVVGRHVSAANGQIKDRLVLSRTVFDAIDRMDSPSLMCSLDGRILWCNEALRDTMSEAKKPYGKTVYDVLGVPFEKIRDASAEDGIGIDFCGSYYIAKYSTIKYGRGGALIILTESVELKTMRDELGMIHEKLEDSEPCVAYILIDNLTEMIQYDNESYRPAAAKIDEIIREWSADAKGILKEYERDRYLIVFERRHLKRYIERKFDILDRIRDIRVGAEQLSVTVSVGISTVYGSFAEKDRAARAALELALGRGGDQVVVKTDEGTEFYGGRSKASRRRSSVRSRVVSNELIMHMSRASNVIIMGHKYPDYDSIASCAGLARIAMFCGVDVNIVCDPADENVKRCMGFFADSEDFERVFVSADEGLDLMQTGTFVILSDVNNLSIVEDRAIVNAAKYFAVIDHHRKQAEYDREPLLEYIEPKASSASELVCEMLEQILPEGSLPASEAQLLLAGIMLDTKQFSRMTGTRTYGAALYLHDCGAEPQAVQELFKMGLDDYQREARFRSNVVIYRGIMAITLCEAEKGDAADKIIASKAAEGLIGVRGVKAAFAITTVGGNMHISARSTGEVNVQLILEKLRGGGHFDTAGAQLKDVNAEQAVIMLKRAIDEYIDVDSAEVK